MTEEEKLESIYRQMQQAMLTKNTDLLAQLIDPAATLTHMNGYVQPLAEWLQQIESEDMKYYSSQEDSIRVNIAENQGILVGRNRVRARIWGAGPATWPLEMTLTFRRDTEGVWVIKHLVATTY